jgi:hypothetical protein
VDRISVREWKGKTKTKQNKKTMELDRGGEGDW